VICRSLKFVLHIFFNQDIDVIFPTDNPQLNQLILIGLLSDRLDFKTVVSGPGLINWDPFFYQFHPEDNLIHIWIHDPNNRHITLQELSVLLQSIDPNNGGPDGWMSGNTTIVDDSIAEQFGYDSIELIPCISYVLVPEQTPGLYTEYELDRTGLPQD
jgi:hypothetical protein